MSGDAHDTATLIAMMGAGTVLTLGGHPLGSGLILLSLGMFLNRG